MHFSELLSHAAAAAVKPNLSDSVLKKTENRILLSVSGLDPCTNGTDLKKKEIYFLI